ncbi:LysR family transcriptional regulator [Gymnodinialimonas sp. 2305UL16-5]|uniref:LysR family transcriptional regulator n=1 Tax=Gymnodinialimonas mytili TaxID=3126503 RepID=UPI0030A85805
MNTHRRTEAEWDDQRAFLAVIEEGSLSAAARRLAISQPTVRTRISALEHALGTALFVRSVNGMAPTQQALALAGHVRAMQRASEAMVRAASSPPNGVGGVVRLSVSEFVGIEVLPPMLAALRAHHPGLRVELILSNTSANLLEQEVDIALRMTDPRQQALVAQKIATIPLGLFAHRDYLERRGVPKSVDDLAHHDIIGPDRSKADLDLAAQVLPSVSPQDFVLRTDSHPAQFAAVRAGLGIAAVQIPVARQNQALRQVLPSLQVDAMDTWLVTHEDLRNVPRVRVVMDHLARAFRT